MLDLISLLSEMENRQAETADLVCITLENPDNPKQWLQFTYDQLNFAYPFTSESAGNLPEMPALAEMDVAQWEAEKFVTLDYYLSDETLPLIAGFARQYAEQILGGMKNWHSKVEIL